MEPKDLPFDLDALVEVLRVFRHAPYPELKHALHPFGFFEMLRGTQRRAFLRVERDWVVKVPLFGGQRSADVNFEMEAAFYESLGDPRHFAPTYYIGLGCVLQRCCQEVDQCSARAIDQATRFCEFVAQRYRVRDLHLGNVGVLEGRPVVFDFDLPETFCLEYLNRAALEGR